MGLGLYITAKMPTNDSTKQRVSRELFEKITSELKSSLPEELQNYILDSRGINNLSVNLHPSEEAVDFELSKNILTCSAKTNSAGPGYHAFLVETLEDIGKKLNIDWNWQNKEGDIGDETSYYELRDYNKLQEEMLIWLKQITAHLLSLKKAKNLMISLPIGYSIIDEFYISSPMGFWEKVWFDEVLEKDISQLHTKGSEFFPWWEKGFNANFYKNCALTTAWVDLPWHTVANENEERQYRFVLDCFRKAKDIDPDIILPRAEIGEIKNYRKEILISPAPLQGGIGYKRRNMERSLTGNWTISIPGYFYEECDYDEDAIVYWFNDKRIQCSSYSITGKAKKDELFDVSLGEIPEHADIVHFEHETQKGWAEIKRCKEGESEFWMLSGRMALPRHFCHITICYNDEQDRDWAVKTWKTVRMRAK